MQSEVDVVIAGGGAVGSACAYFLRDLGFPGSIMVVEPDPSYRAAASTRSASSIRRQFSTPVNIALSMFGMEFLKAAPRRLARDGSHPTMSLVESSYLYLATELGRAALERQVAFQQGLAVAVTLRDRAALVRRYPWLETSDLAAGADTSEGEGWFDGYALLSALRAANERSGIGYVRDRVIGFDASAEGLLVGVRLEAAGRVGCRHAVDAAGTHSRELAATVGVELPVFARKRTVFVFTCPHKIPRSPLVIDPTGLWFRPEGDRWLCGPPAEPDPDVSEEDFEVDHALFEERAWPILAHRVPAFEEVRMTSAWAGHYDYNVFDQNAFIGPVPGMPNLLLACGFSGHGLQHAPGIGRGLAEFICFGGYRSIDLAALSYERYLAHAPLREGNVI